MRKTTAFLLALLISLAAVMPMTVSAADQRQGITVGRITENVNGTSVNYADSYYYSEKRLEKMPHTFEAWVYLPISSYSQRGGIILANYAGANKDVFFTFEIHTAGIPRLVLSEPDGTFHDYKMPKAKIKPNTWTHLAIVYGGGAAGNQILCYINGQLKYSTSEDLWFVPDDSVLDNVVCLGGDLRPLNEQAFRGTLSDVAIYSDVRTEKEIAADMTAPDTSDSELLAYYKLSEAEPCQSVADSSGNGYHMTYGKMWLTEEEIQAIRAADPHEYTYSIAFIPDIQYSTQSYPENLAKLYDWLAANAERKNIKFAIGLGDITNRNTAEEWVTATREIAKLDGVIPYSILRGNHDITYNDETLYDANFGQSDDSYYRHVAQNGGFYKQDSVANTYLLFTAGETDYIVISLDFGAQDDVLAWADSVLTQYSDRRAIIATHGYLFYDGTTLDENDYACPSSYRSKWNDGDDMWEKLISKHQNVAIVASGHMLSDNIILAPDTGDGGNTVYQMLIDPQSTDKKLGGLGIVAMMYFTEDGSHAVTEYYCAARDMYFREFNARLSLDFPTDAEQTTPPPADTTSAPAADTTTTPAPVSDTTLPDDTAKDGGCGGVITAAALLPALIGAAAVGKRKRK